MGKGVIDGLPVGTILHGKAYDYEIKRALGQGSFGITYLADVKLRGELGTINATVYVAIKEFFMSEINGRDKTSVTSSSKGGIFDKYKKKFIREAMNLSNLKHENIIKVIESFEANDTFYYSMEYLDGGSLDDLIARKGSLPESEALEYAKQIASALSFMHSRNMLHLDLKPSNVMLRDGNAVLIDFGLSKQYDENGNPESSTTIGAGTPGYAPIEQSYYQDEIRTELPATMDVYAFGATLFKMLTGHKPPVASDILNGGFPSNELKANRISDGVVQLVQQSMAPLKMDRVPSANVLEHKINQLITELDDKTIIEVESMPSSKDFPTTEIIEIERDAESGNNTGLPQNFESERMGRTSQYWPVLFAIVSVMSSFILYGLCKTSFFSSYPVGSFVLTLSMSLPIVLLLLLSIVAIIRRNKSSAIIMGLLFLSCVLCAFAILGPDFLAEALSFSYL